jgi:predicted oxidoreductase
VPGLFRRGHDEPPAPPSDAARGAAGDAEDSPEQLSQRLWSLVQFINHSAGQLPVDAVVLAREITDTVREVIATSADRDLDVYAVVQINGIVGDYLPTTLRAYLALDPAITEREGPSGRTPRTALREQLESLADAADEMLQATHAHDVDALFTQGNFLRTKYTRSDLDL